MADNKPPRPKPKRDQPPGVPADSCPVVGFGASAGGLEALSEVLQHLSTNPGFALVLIQHLDPKHASILSELLARATSLPVKQASNGMAVEGNHIYVIPPNSEMTISKGKLVLNPRPIVGQHMPVDAFFQSLAQDQLNKAVGVVLSGTASDGTIGLKAIKAQGGITFAQDVQSAKYDGMPRSAIAAGCVDFVLPPAEIASELVRICHHPYLKPSPETSSPGTDEDEPGFNEIFAQLRQATGVDFSAYKAGTIRRRTMRRMALHKIESVQRYARYLKENRGELESLFQDMLINVTAFFREPATFEQIKNKVFPAAFKNRAANDVFRMWIPGCSTGEEAYSASICLMEYMQSAGIEIPFQIFGTDLSEPALEIARAGVYPESISTEVSPERLRQFFVKVENSYKIVRSIRDSCVFARQNVTKDPPFSKIDQILCRNLLIYLGPALQMNVIRLFHYALRQNGTLVLGQSESITGAEDLFVPEDRKFKIYSRRQSPAAAATDFGIYAEPSNRPPVERRPAQPDRVDLSRQVDHLILSQYSPPAIVVDQNMQIVYFRGQTAPYLEHSPGDANLNVMRMTPAGIGLEIRKLAQKAQATNGKVSSGPIHLPGGARQLDLSISVIPIAHQASSEPHFLAVFEQVLPAPRGTRTKGKRGDSLAQDRILELEQELASTRKYLQGVVEEQEAASEELKSAHEELQSGNEELQSTNEELLTAKEELQSTNEELTTVNEEMQNRNTELQQLNNDLVNLLSSVNIPIMMLGNDLRIRRFTPQAERILNLLTTDIGRPISDFRLKIDIPDLAGQCHDVLTDLIPREREVKDAEGRSYSMWVRPYRTADNKIDGVVVTLQGLTDRKPSADTRYQRLFESAPDGVLIADAVSGEIVDANPALINLFGYPRSALINVKFWKSPLFAGAGLDPAILHDLKTAESALSLLSLSTASGEVIETEVLWSRFTEAERQLVQFHLRDARARKQESYVSDAASEFQEVRKLDAVAKLAGAVAHDFSNPLTTMLGYCDLLGQQLAVADQPSRDLLAQIRGAAERASTFARQLLTFGRKQIARPVVLDVNHVIREIQQLLKVMLPETIRLETELSVEQGLVKLEHGRLEQLILNLVLNARDSMPNGGVVTVKTEMTTVDQELAQRRPTVPEGRYLVISVKDTDGGMEPFLATRSGARESGLGLAATYDTVRKSGGHIWAYSELGVGATFSVYLPPVESNADSGAETKSGVAGGSETILLVEDDLNLRSMVSRLLGQVGYRVLEAGSGPEALRMAADFHEPIDLLVTNVIMPVMSGREVAFQLAPARPGMKVLYVSGHSEKAIADHGVLEDGICFLPKPFTWRSLAAKVREALER
jgi:two-component system CheB/CheR fusion protein